MLGAFQLNWIFAVLAGGGVVLACWYMLRLHQGLMHEPLRPTLERIRDLRIGEAALLAPLVALMILIGVFPRPVGDLARPSVAQYVTIATGAQAGTPETATPQAPQ
jgi:NADH-quinone oxidoreductase subunit M